MEEILLTENLVVVHKNEYNRLLEIEKGVVELRKQQSEIIERYRDITLSLLERDDKYMGVAIAANRKAHIFIKKDDPRLWELIDKYNDIKELKRKYIMNRLNVTSYISVDPDSHYWTNISQMLEWLKYQNDPENKYLVAYIKRGLENTLEQGYDINKTKDDD